MSSQKKEMFRNQIRDMCFEFYFFEIFFLSLAILYVDSRQA